MSNRQPEEKRAAKKQRASTNAGLPPPVATAAPQPQKPVKFARGTRDSLHPVQTRAATPTPHLLPMDDEPDTDEIKLVTIETPDTVVIDPDDPIIEGDAIDALDLT